MRKNSLNYPVEFVNGVFGDNDKLAEIIRKATGAETPRMFIVADYNVVMRNEGLGARIGRYVKAHGLALAGTPEVMGGGEKVKSDGLQSVMRILTAMTEAKLSEQDVVIAIGGGTILDIAGYAAGQYLGGVKLIRVPTTPAAMFEAAFAERAAVDFLNRKDALQVPSVPAAVLVDTAFANTVLQGVWRAGYGEAVRIAVMNEPKTLSKLEDLAPAFAERSPEALARAVELVHAIRVKKGGTDFALALAGELETMSGWKLPHGYAVAIALVAELADSEQRGELALKTASQAAAILTSAGALDGLDHSRNLLERTGRDLYTKAKNLLK